MTTTVSSSNNPRAKIMAVRVTTLNSILKNVGTTSLRLNL